MNREFVKLKLTEKEKAALMALKKSVEQKYKMAFKNVNDWFDFYNI